MHGLFNCIPSGQVVRTKRNLRIKALDGDVRRRIEGAVYRTRSSTHVLVSTTLSVTRKTKTKQEENNNTNSEKLPLSYLHTAFEQKQTERKKQVCQSFLTGRLRATLTNDRHVQETTNHDAQAAYVRKRLAGKLRSKAGIIKSVCVAHSTNWNLIEVKKGSCSLKPNGRDEGGRRLIEKLTKKVEEKGKVTEFLKIRWPM